MTMHIVVTIYVCFSNIRIYLRMKYSLFNATYNDTIKVLKKNALLDAAFAYIKMIQSHIPRF